MSDYDERVYAGVLGKIIGVYLGRPFEGWSYDSITERFGEIDRYVHEDLGQDLVVADDDISGTFTFLRSLPDNGNDPNITPEMIGNTWLNYIIPDRTILWWGGYGVSTEHTAFLNLQNGIPAPCSGSIAVNSKVVAEQIGAQIFIDGWGMICPGDPERAADYARRAASVSHDGEAIYGAQVVAAIVAAAFIETDINRLLDTALELIPTDCVIARVIDDVREWHAENPSDWRATRTRIAERYGYQRFGGGCHMVPNHALVIHALLHGDGDFSKSMMIVNTCGWDTDCNAANVGCILGVRGGLSALESGYDWRGPVADRILLPTADGGRCITDAVQESQRIVNICRALANEPPMWPKDGARLNFALPGAVQGFTSNSALLSNAVPPGADTRALLISMPSAAAGEPVQIQTPTFLQPDELARPGYGLIGSPTLYPGQLLSARLLLPGYPAGALLVRPFVKHFDSEGALSLLPGPLQTIHAGEDLALTWTIPSTGRQPIADIGIEVIGAPGMPTDLYLDFMTWSGAPECELHKPEAGRVWQNAWLSGATRMEFPENQTGFQIVQNEGTCLVTQGAREWSDYTVSITANAHLCERFGLLARVQGLRRFYALIFNRDGTVQLIKALNRETVLADTHFAWQWDQTYELTLSVTGNTVYASVDGHTIFEVIDSESPLLEGAVGILCTSGSIFVETVHVGRARM